MLTYNSQCLFQLHNAQSASKPMKFLTHILLSVLVLKVYYVCILPLNIYIHKNWNLYILILFKELWNGWYLSMLFGVNAGKMVMFSCPSGSWVCHDSGPCGAQGAPVDVKNLGPSAPKRWHKMTWILPNNIHFQPLSWHRRGFAITGLHMWSQSSKDAEFLLFWARLLLLFLLPRFCQSECRVSSRQLIVWGCVGMSRQWGCGHMGFDVQLSRLWNALYIYIYICNPCIVFHFL